MYAVMRGLLERTESLKMVIEEALATHKPRTDRSMSAKSSAGFETSPQSSSDGHESREWMLRWDRCKGTK